MRPALLPASVACAVHQPKVFPSATGRSPLKPLPGRYDAFADHRRAETPRNSLHRDVRHIGPNRRRVTGVIVAAFPAAPPALALAASRAMPPSLAKLRRR